MRKGVVQREASPAVRKHGVDRHLDWDPGAGPARLLDQRHAPTAADMAPEGATGTADRKDPPAPSIVPPYAALGSVAFLLLRPPLLRSLWRVPPTWAYWVESGPK